MYKTLYIQKSVSENTRNAVLGLEKYKRPLLLLHTKPHQTFCHQQPSHHTQYKVWSLFVDGSHGGRILKKGPATNPRTKHELDAAGLSGNY